MRIFIVLLSAFFISFPYWNAQAGNKSELFDSCMTYKKDESFCTCAMGQPYDELASRQGNHMSEVGKSENLRALERQYQEAYDFEISKGGLSPGQIDRICEVVEEYYDYLDEVGVDYKATSTKKSLGGKRGGGGISSLSSKEIQEYTLKRRELSKRIHELNHAFQRLGAKGSFSSLDAGACLVGLKVKWEKEKIQKKKAGASVNVDIRQLMAQSSKVCVGSSDR